MTANTTEVLVAKNVTGTCVKAVLTSIVGRAGGAIIATNDTKTKKRVVFEFLPTLNNLSERREALNRAYAWMNGKTVSHQYDLAWFCTTRNENRATGLACELFSGNPDKRYFTTAPAAPKKTPKKPKA